jgi:hypothetical protein
VRRKGGGANRRIIPTGASCLDQLQVRVASPPCYLIAWGLIGEPTAAVTGSGGATNMNS